MFAVPVSEGALFYGKTRRRQAVAFDDELRRLTSEIAAATRDLLAAGRTPRPIYDSKRCETCSLKELCQPKRLERAGSVGAWLRRRTEEPGAPLELPP
jgi:CRISPR-associated exonuclease Cas4